VDLHWRSTVELGVGVCFVVYTVLPQFGSGVQARMMGGVLHFCCFAKMDKFQGSHGVLVLVRECGQCMIGIPSSRNSGTRLISQCLDNSPKNLDPLPMA
jgi:hypothetical protein